MIGNANLRALPQESANRIRYRVGRRKAVQLVVGDADDRPAHGRKRIRSARIADAACFPFVGFATLVLHVQLRLRPAQVASKAGFSRDRPGSRTCFHLVIHTRYAQSVSTVHERQAQYERLLRLAGRSGAVGCVSQHPDDFARSVDRRVARGEITQLADRGKRGRLISGINARALRLIRAAQFIRQLPYGHLALLARRNLHKRKSGNSRVRIPRQSIERPPCEGSRAHVLLAAFRESAIRSRAHQYMGRRIDTDLRVRRP